MWSALIFVGMLAFRHWSNNPPRPSTKWETSVEEAEEVAAFSAYRNTHHESPLRKVSGGDHGMRDRGAIR